MTEGFDYTTRGKGTVWTG